MELWKGAESCLGAYAYQEGPCFDQIPANFVQLWAIEFDLLFHFVCLFGFYLSLFFLVRLARDLSVLFTLSKNQLLVLLIIF